nr:DUF3015 domain-containing protein [Gammaproteobacteria bacterium]NIR92324.1 DUF3015 domain-containing protein [Gammaproteobacteria bacterium]
DNFAKIFSSENVTSEEVLTALNDVMASDKVLSQYAV